MKVNGLTIVLVVAIVLLVKLAEAEVSAVSEDTALNTRSVSVVTTTTDEGMDTRTYTDDWSEMRSLNTRKIVGTVIRLK